MATFYTGNTGRSTGEHLDFRVWDVEKGGYTDPTDFTRYMTVGGKPLTEQFGVTSGYQPEGRTLGGVTRPHMGIDYGTPTNTAVDIAGGKFLTTFNDKGGGGITNQYGITGDDGRAYEILLMHGSDKNSVLSDGARTDGMPTNPQSPDPSSPSPTADVEVKPASMSPDEINKKYDQMRMAGDALGAREFGLAQNKRLFG